MKIALVIPSLRCGGAERAVSTLATYWSEMGHSVHLITLEHAPTEPPFFPLGPKVALHHLVGFAPHGVRAHEVRAALDRDPPGSPLACLWLTLRRLGSWQRFAVKNSRGPTETDKNAPTDDLLQQRMFSLPRTAKRLRSQLRLIAPDITISSITGCNLLTLAATVGLEQKVVVWEHSHPTLYRPTLLRRYLCSLLYPRAAQIVVLGERLRAYARPHLQSLTRAIPNPLAPVSLSASNTAQREHLIVALGRLQPIKGFDLLIEAFARVAKAHPTWRLEIWGEGPERDRLEAMVERRTIGSQVRLPGVTHTPDEIMSRAAVVVVPSRLEGFGLTAAEALSAGTPVVCFDCPGSLSEVVQHGHNGLVVANGDMEALRSALDLIVTDAALRERLASNAAESTAPYRLPNVAARWEQLFIDMNQIKDRRLPAG